MDAARVRSMQRESFLDFIQTLSTCDALQEHISSALRSQVHDLTELLAAFDLCELQDPHLIAVRDRAFQRDITPEVERLRVYCVERQRQQNDIHEVMSAEPMEQDVAIKHHEEPSESSESTLGVMNKAGVDIEGLQQRMELLEREIVILRLRQELLEETTPRLQCPDPTAQDQDAGNDHEHVKRAVRHELCGESTTVIQEQQERIVELENALATESTKNAAMQHKSRRYQQVEEILHEFSRCNTSTAS